MHPEEHRSERAVRSEDSTLTPGANELLTHELQDVVGHDRVAVPDSVVDHRRDRHATHSPLLAPFVEMELALVVTLLLGALTLGVVAVAAGGAWVVVGVFVALLLATAAVLGLILHMAAEEEHLSPETAAALEDQGVANPDHGFNQLVHEFEDDQPGGDAEGPRPT
jgi:hypothetical protein